MFLNVQCGFCILWTITAGDAGKRIVAFYHQKIAQSYAAELYTMIGHKLRYPLEPNMQLLLNFGYHVEIILYYITSLFNEERWVSDMFQQTIIQT